MNSANGREPLFLSATLKPATIVVVSAEHDRLLRRVYELVSQSTGVRIEKLTPQSRLNYEIGMDGDDAGEFFQQYAQVFGVDLEQLVWHWDQHFNAEGMSLSTGAIIFGPPFAAGFVLSEVSRTVAAWVWFLGSYVAWWLLLWVWCKLRKRPGPVPLTIEDLLQAAAANRWIKVYPPAP